MSAAQLSRSSLNPKNSKRIRLWTWTVNVSITKWKWRISSHQKSKVSLWLGIELVFNSLICYNFFKKRKSANYYLIDLKLNEIIRHLNQLPMAPVCPIGWREVACQPEPPLGCVGLSSAWPDRIDPTAAQRFDFDLISILFFFSRTVCPSINNLMLHRPAISSSNSDVLTICKWDDSSTYLTWMTIFKKKSLTKIRATNTHTLTHWR